MAYVDVNVPVIEKIKLPSGNSYYIADREIRDVVDTLSQTIAGGVSFTVAWDGTSTPVVANIPAGVKVVYNSTTYTGTLSANNAAPGAFYLVKSSTTPSDQTQDVYDEYVPVGADGSKTWEKIGDTQVDLSDTVKNVTLTKSTDTVIGTDATFTVTQPSVTLATDSTSGTGKVQVVTGISSATATGDGITVLTGLGTKSTASVIGGSSTFTVTQPSVTLSTNASSGTGRVQVVTGVSGELSASEVNAVTDLGTPSSTYLVGSASGANVAWNSKDATTVVTGIGTSSTDTFIKTLSTTTSKLATTTITGVSGSTTASSATAATSQTTAKGTGTTSTDNTNWLKNISVSNGVLTIGAASMDTQTTTQYTFTSVTVPKAASAATRVATGAVNTNDANGASVVISASAGSTANAVTALGTISTDSVIGDGATFTVTQPGISLSTNASSGTGRVKVLTGLGTPTTATVLGNESSVTVTPTTTYLVGSASGANVAWNSKDAKTVVTGYTPTTDTALGDETTITVTPTTTYIKGSASGANVAWNSKDSVTVLKNDTDVNVTKNG